MQLNFFSFYIKKKNKKKNSQRKMRKRSFKIIKVIKE